MTQKLRLSPSGPVIGEVGNGFRLRFGDHQATMTGSLAVPTAKSPVCADGFGGAGPIVMAFPAPKAEHMYRAEFRLDLLNTTTSHTDQVVLFIETSIDGGAWTVRSKNAHVVNSAGVANSVPQARECSVSLPLTLGADLGVLPDSTEIEFRVSAQLTSGTETDVEVSTLATSGSVSGLNGTLYYQIEETLAA
jgi:hypothetical protein